ncbi:MAG: 50S ribosomal protein L11 methyltransferase [Bryobacteraceae bacterium]|nr:50S ribosomal protein L11 methyltransferase [Bryobacteraceae bacterium]
MYRLTLTIHPDDEDEVVAELSELDLAGISQYNRDDGQLDLMAWFTSPPVTRLAGTLEFVEDQNWNALHQATWQPLLVGRRWYLAPPDDSSETPPGRTRLSLKPGLAFGNGDHATTQLCLELLEELVQSGDNFLDVGCGSGLLGEAAALLGGRAFGCDLDPRDLPPNAFQGSLAAVRAGSIAVGVMNIQAGVLAELWPALANAVTRDAVLSGYLREQAATVEALICPPWRIAARREKEGWCALAATRLPARLPA